MFSYHRFLPNENLLKFIIENRKYLNKKLLHQDIKPANKFKRHKLLKLGDFRLFIDNWS